MRERKQANVKNVLNNNRTFGKKLKMHTFVS
jgi:hypothetical protein